MLAEEFQLASLVRGEELHKHQPTEQLGEYRYRQDEAGPATRPALSVQRVLPVADVPAACGRAATPDRRHQLGWAEADVAGVSVPTRRSVSAEDIRALESGRDHARRAVGRRLGPLGGQQREPIERADDRVD